MAGLRGGRWAGWGLAEGMITLLVEFFTCRDPWSLDRGSCGEFALWSVAAASESFGHLM